MTTALPVQKDFQIDFVNGTFARDAKGGLAMTADGDSIAQAIELTCNLHKGELFFDRGLGFPWLDSVLVKNPNLITIRQLIKEKIESVPGVVEVLQLNTTFDKASRRLVVTFVVSKDQSEVNNPLTGSFTIG